MCYEHDKGVRSVVQAQRAAQEAAEAAKRATVGQEAKRATVGQEATDGASPDSLQKAQEGSGNILGDVWQKSAEAAQAAQKAVMDAADSTHKALGGNGDVSKVTSPVHTKHEITRPLRAGGCVLLRCFPCTIALASRALLARSSWLVLFPGLFSWSSCLTLSSCLILFAWPASALLALVMRFWRDYSDPLAHFYVVKSHVVRDL